MMEVRFLNRDCVINNLRYFRNCTMKKYLFILACLLPLALPVKGSASSNGTIGVSLTLTNGCLVNGSASQNGISFGTLNFGDHSATFSDLSTQLSNSGPGGNAFGIQCTTNSYSVQITGNANTAAPTSLVGIPGTTARYLRSANNSTQGVAYSLYSDSSFTSEIANNTQLPRLSTVDGVDYYTLYGRIRGDGKNSGIAPGNYTDTIYVSVNY